MRLDNEFIRLPLRFDAARLAAEAAALAEPDWRPHPQGHRGNSALPLISRGGDPADDGVNGPMRPTPHLARCPYLYQVLASLRTPLGRTRLMRIDAGGEATPHVDTNYYWHQRLRVHVPVATDPRVQFLCGGAAVHMAPGECWVFDTWRRHNVVNPTDRPRVHLVADTVGSAELWDAVDGGGPEREIRFEPAARPELHFEAVNFPTVMTPWEMQSLLLDAMDGVAGDGWEELLRAAGRVVKRWRGLWARFGDSAGGLPEYRAAVERFAAEVEPHRGSAKLPNGTGAVEILHQIVVRAALANADAPAASAAPKETQPVTFDRPVFIIAAPRSGSTLLFEALARSPDFVTVGGESHAQFESIPELHPSAGGFESNRLTGADAPPPVAERVRQNFIDALRDRDGGGPPGGPVRLLEKTPKNALRVRFLRAVFPEARFIYLVRKPRENVSSVIDAWRSGKFVTYPELPDWGGPPWSLLLVPGWRDLAGKPVEEIAAAQWVRTHENILDDLGDTPADRWTSVTYERFLEDPQGECERLCRFAGVRWDRQLGKDLPAARHTLTAPDPDKWKKNAAELERVLPGTRETMTKVEAALSEAARSRPVQPPPPATPNGQSAETPPDLDLRSVHTSNFPALLEELGVSLLVTTYQAGRVIVCRPDNGTLNTHFRDFSMPMGLAYDCGRLAMGTKLHVWEFRDNSEVAKKVDPVGRHDACFLPRWTHITGDIRIHEIAYSGDDLWIVNTRFSCLCTLDREHSFVPRWRPPFVTALTPEDRCHLNGLAVVDGIPKYVTCLGMTDHNNGWRDNKAWGGALLDVATGQPVARDLSMPHSPRVYRDKLWVLESGAGTIAVVDPARGTREPVAEVPGFTRGVDFVGPLAFIGLSQVRESAVFSGIPITERLKERTCGVWVVNIETGQTVAFLRFEGSVQEIFAVQAVPHRFPEIMNSENELLSGAYILPDDALAQVPTEMRAG